MTDGKTIPGKVVRQGSYNPLIVVEPEEVVAWLRSVADQHGFADRASCAVQISVEQPFEGGKTYHAEPPKLVFMVSNVPGSRTPPA